MYRIVSKSVKKRFIFSVFLMIFFILRVGAEEKRIIESHRIFIFYCIVRSQCKYNQKFNSMRGFRR